MWKGLFKLEVRGAEQDLIPYVGQLKLPNVPFEGGNVIPDIDSLLDGPYNVVQLHAHHGEVFHPSLMTCSVSNVIDWEEALRYS